MAASVVGICNRALQKLGAARITSLSEDSVNARACNTAWEACRLAELRKHPWSCAIQRASLAADATAPDWGRANAFTLPSDYIRLVKPYPEDNSYTLDYVIESGKILSDEDAPLYIRYVGDVTDAAQMDPLLREAISCRMAIEMCEEITQSNSKKAGVKADYTEVIAEAKRANAIEQVPSTQPDDEWITVRDR